MLKSSWVRKMKWSYLNHQTIVKVWEFLKPSSLVFVILYQPCVEHSTLNSLCKLKIFDLHKLFKWKIVKHESCRKLSDELTIKIWIIFDNWFESYGQNTPSLDTQFSWLTSLWIPEHITSLDSELILVMTRWIVP